ncbi:MAG: alpha/beta hydrolase [Gemmatimonadota bacterium]|nr:MAG: alpha/beta hydrolase [Gemmatimonadota bacterium]
MKIITFISLVIFSQNLFGQPIPYGYNEEAGGYFDVGNNTKLYYEIYGEGDPLLILHGGVFGYIDEFEYLIPKLVEKYQVICLATRGHVKSDIGNEPYTYEQRATDAYKLIQNLKLENVTVVGFSDGGFTAYKLAAIYPDIIEKIVVMGAGDDPPKDEPGTSSYSADSLMKNYGDYFKKRVENMPEPDRWNESLNMLNDLYNNSFVSHETFKKIKCPVLVMSGDGDEFSSPEECLAAHRYLPDSQLSIIPGCGHVLLYCNFPAVWESMKIFLGYKN